MTDVLNIYQRINEVRKHISYIQKDGQVQNYKAVTHDAVTAELRPKLVEYGVLVVPRLISSSVRDSGTVTGKGSPIIRYEAWYEIDFINIDEPEQKVTIPIESHALDQGDKAPGKAISYATKYALLKLFNIETGENDESRLEQKPKPYTEDQRKLFNRLIESNDQLGFYLYSREFLDFDNQNMEGWTALHSDYKASLPRGSKGKESERLKEMEETGKELFQNILDAIENGDAFLFAENLEGASESTKKLLARNFTEDELATARQFKEQNNG